MTKGWYARISNIDRRIIFLFIALAVIIPTLFEVNFPEEPTPMVAEIYNKVENLPAGSRVLLAFDYDPATKAELEPMANAWLRQCFLKKFKVYTLALWPTGQQLAVEAVNLAIDFLKKVDPSWQIVYGQDYVNLGYKSGLQGVIKVVLTNLETLYSTDINGTHIKKIPAMEGIVNLKSFDMIISISAGEPGSKEWIQFGSDPAGVLLVSGSTAVQAPLLYPYYPRQMVGVLGGLKGAAEYEALLFEHRLRPMIERRLTDLGQSAPGEKIVDLARAEFGYTQLGISRMGPQSIAHLVIISFIVIGNITFFLDRRRQRRK